jgi:hypothetical protein
MPLITPIPAGTFTGIPSHLKALFRSASWQEHRLNYSHIGSRFIEIVPNLVPYDFDEETSWENLLTAELSPTLVALATDQEPTTEHLDQLKAWTRLRFPRIAEKVPSNRWAMFARGAAQTIEEGWW